MKCSEKTILHIILGRSVVFEVPDNFDHEMPV